MREERGREMERGERAEGGRGERDAFKSSELSQHERRENLRLMSEAQRLKGA